MSATAEGQINWREYLAASNREIRRNELAHGLVFEADPGDTPKQTVLKYVETFGRLGIGEREVVRETGIPRSTVKRALKALEAEGLVMVHFTLTRGKAASRRTMYRPRNRARLVLSLNAAENANNETSAFERTHYTCGGGRKVGAKGTLE